LITTRPGSGIESLQRFHDFKVKNLTDREINSFIDLLVENKERAKQIKNNIDKNNSTDYREYLKNPLLLSMFILAFENHPEIPNKKSAFYKNVFDTLYSKHDGITKGSFPREKKTKLKRENFEDILSIFSYLTIIEGEYSYTNEYLSKILAIVKKNKRDLDFEIEDIIYDFQTSISIMIKDGFEYKFPHRSMQEYFAANFISQLPSNKKSKAYTRLIKVFKKSSYDLSFNFWTLSKELDYVGYYEYFILKELKKTFNLIKDKEGENLLVSFAKIWEASINIFPETDDKEIRAVILRRANLHETIRSYENIYHWSNLSEFPNNKKLTEQLIKLTKPGFDKQNQHKIITICEKFNNKKVNELLISNKINDVIKVYRKTIWNKILDIQNDLKEKNDDLNDILDF